MLAWVVLVGALLSARAGDQHVLAVPYRSQLDGTPYAMANCGPTSLSMALAYYGIDASPWDLRVEAMKAQHSWVDDEGGYSDSYGVFVYNLATVTEVLGLQPTGLWTRESGRLDRLHAWQADDLRREIQLGRPVIVLVEYRSLPAHRGSAAIDDHYIVVHGSVGSEFVYSDPFGIDGGGPEQTIAEGDLLVAMSQASTPRAGFAVSKPRG